MPMLVVMDQTVADAEIAAVGAHLASYNLLSQVSRAAERTYIVIAGNRFPPTLGVELERFPGVQHITARSTPYPLASRELRSQDTQVQVRGVTVGGNACVVIAGPCSVESRNQGLGGSRGRRHDAAWRRVQAPHIAL